MTIEQKLILLESFAASENLFDVEAAKELQESPLFEKILTGESAVNLINNLGHEVIIRSSPSDLIQLITLMQSGQLVISAEVLTVIAMLSFFAGVEKAESVKSEDELEKLFKLS